MENQINELKWQVEEATKENQKLALELARIKYETAVEASNACFSTHSLLHALGQEKDGDFEKLEKVSKMTDEIHAIITERVNRYLEEMGSDLRWK